MKLKMITLAVLAASASAYLIGCNSDSVAAAAQTGVFIDAHVEGLYFETSSGEKGYTNAQGEFKFKAGDTVTFWIGGKTGYQLGSAVAAKGMVDVFDIAGSTNVEDTRTTNLLRLLQSLDNQGTPDDGIQIPAGTNLNGACDLTDPALATCGGKFLTVSAVEARAHFLKSLTMHDGLTVASVEFVETVARPADVDSMSVTQATAKAIVTFSDGNKAEYPLTYNTLFGVNDKVGGNAYAAGQAFDHQMQPLMDPFGQPVILETPDANSLLNVDGNLWLVSHLEYDWLLSNGAQSYTVPGWYSRVPTGMLLTGIDQAANGMLSVKSQRPIDFSSVNGTWINCFGSQTPWNTHLGSEEDYDLQYNPLTGSYGGTTAGVAAMTDLYWKNTKTANPYHYGWIPEVTVNKDGSNSVVKHYAMGRGTWEMSKVMADGKTALMGDDGTNVMLAMFVADTAKNLSAGTLYAAKWTQTSGTGAGAADLTWFKLGHATDAEIKAIIDGGATFTSIWDAVAPVAGACTTGYTRVRAGSTADECLMLKPGMEKAAAFMETRRYAAYLGATTEWNKMEGIAFNAKDNKAYIAMSYIDKGMKADAAGPVDHIQIAKINAGGTYTLDMAGNQVTANGGEAIASSHVPTKMYMEAGLLGEDIAVDAFGNTANPDKIANTDNVFFSEKMRTLFIGEDSGTHVNNYIWAYNVDTKKLTRILSAVSGAENTGLQVLDDVKGKGAYIMGNTQHWGEIIGTVPADLKTQLQAKIGSGVNKGGFGYLGGLPALK